MTPSSCIIPGCREQLARNALCLPHDIAWLESGECKRVAGIAEEDLPAADVSERCDVAFVDFVRRIAAEERH